MKDVFPNAVLLKKAEKNLKALYLLCSFRAVKEGEKKKKKGLCYDLVYPLS